MAISKVGYVLEMHGNKFNMSVTNAPAHQILNNSNTNILIGSSLIVSSPITDNYLDTGTPSMFMTDREGNPLRLTYTMQPGNGLVLDDPEFTGVLKMNIDNSTIKTFTSQINNNKRLNGALYVNVPSLIAYNSSLESFKHNNLSFLRVNTSSIIDNKSLKVAQSRFLGEHISDPSYSPDFINNPGNPQPFYVDTNFICDNFYITTVFEENTYLRTQVSDLLPEHAYLPITGEMPTNFNGETYMQHMGDLYHSYITKLSLNLNNLIDHNTITLKSKPYSAGHYAKEMDQNYIAHYSNSGKYSAHNTYYDYGYFNYQENPTYSYLSVNTENLTKASDKKYGVVKIDSSTLKTNSKGNLYVETSNLRKADKAYYGVVKPDYKTIIVNSNKEISVDTNNLTVASSTNYGVVKLDNETIKLKKSIYTGYDGSPIDQSVIYVDATMLKCGSNMFKGVCKGDTRTISVKEGEISLSLDYQNKIKILEEEVNKLKQQLNNYTTSTSPKYSLWYSTYGGDIVGDDYDVKENYNYTKLSITDIRFKKTAYCPYDSNVISSKFYLVDPSNKSFPTDNTKLQVKIDVVNSEVGNSNIMENAMAYQGYNSYSSYDDSSYINPLAYMGIYNTLSFKIFNRTVKINDYQTSTTSVTIDGIDFNAHLKNYYDGNSKYKAIECMFEMDYFLFDTAELIYFTGSGGNYYTKPEDITESTPLHIDTEIIYKVTITNINTQEEITSFNLSFNANNKKFYTNLNDFNNFSMSLG